MANVILIHGRNANAASWNGMDEKLREASHIVASPTLKGHVDPAFKDLSDASALQFELLLAALSQPSSIDATLSEHVDQIGAELPPAGKAVLIGHSQGGMAISAAATRWPDRVEAVVYLAAMLPSDGDSGESLHKMISSHVKPREFAADFFSILPEAADALVRQPESADGETFSSSGRFEALTHHYIATKHDGVVPPTAQSEMFSKYPAIKLWNIDTGHFPQYQDRETLLKILEDILK